MSSPLTPDVCKVSYVLNGTDFSVYGTSSVIYHIVEVSVSKAPRCYLYGSMVSVTITFSIVFVRESSIVNRLLSTLSGYSRVKMDHCINYV